MKIWIQTSLALLLLCGSAQAQGYVEAVNLPQPVGGVYSQPIVGYENNGTVGWTFSPSENILVSSLGWLGGTNASLGVMAGLWNENGTFLGSAAIDSNSQVIDGSAYEAISPILLAANQSFVVGVSLPGQSLTYIGLLNSPTANSINYSTANLSQGSGFALPAVWTDSQGFLPAATFLFQSVPEPSAMSLSALGGLFFLWRRWKARAV
jgi:hypothetical protein